MHLCLPFVFCICICTVVIVIIMILSIQKMCLSLIQGMVISHCKFPTEVGLRIWRWMPGQTKNNKQHI